MISFYEKEGQMKQTRIIFVFTMISLCFLLGGCKKAKETITEKKNQAAEDAAVVAGEYERMKEQQHTAAERPLEELPPQEADDDINAPVEQGVNAKGQTYGPFRMGVLYDDGKCEWDLMAVYQNGVAGYVYSAELNGNHYLDPDSGREYIPVYASDGETLKGYFFFDE